MIWADGDSERAALARLNHEIETLEPLIRDAELQGDPDARFCFQYAWLRRDLKQIRFAIEEHIEAPQSEPRKVAPLLGDTGGEDRQWTRPLLSVPGWRPPTSCSASP